MQQYPAVGHILIHSINLAFGASGLNRISKINVSFGLGSSLCVEMRPIYSSALVILNLTLLAMDISNFRKNCYRVNRVSFHIV